MAETAVTSNLGWDNFFSTTTTGALTATTTTIPLATPPTSTEGFLVLDPGGANEIIFYNSVSGNNVIVPTTDDRGRGDSTAQPHSSGITVKMNTVGQMFEALQAGTALATSAITTAKIANDAVTATKVDWATTGADGGIWWEELGRTTLGGAGDTISITTIAARKYLRIYFWGIASGSIRGVFRFNNDSGNNYAYRTSTNGAADVTANTQSAISTIGTGAFDVLVVLDVINVSAKEKYASGFYVNTTTGVGNPPGRVEIVGKWVNTSAQITRVDVVNDQAGDFASGSEVLVLGHD